MMTEKPYDQPSEVNAEGGEVVVDGPDGVAVSFTPDAAEETSHRLRDAAAQAADEDNAAAEGAGRRGR